MIKKVLVCFVFMMSLFLYQGRLEINSYAAEICQTEEECEQIIIDNRNEISSLEEQEASIRDEINVTEEDIAETTERIAETEGIIRELNEHITQLQSEIVQKENEIALGEAEAIRLEGEIADLNELIANRMRITQRVLRNNAMIEMLSESENFTDFIRRFRAISHLSQGDANLMDELSDLINQQQNILVTLRQQGEELAIQRADLSVQKEASIAEQQALEGYKSQLKEQQERLAQQMHDVRAAMSSAEESIEIAREQQELLESLVVPEVQLPPETPLNNESNNANNSNNSEISQTPPPVANQMFIIPLERGRVTCEFACYAGHTGIDLGNFGDTSTRVLAAASGVVTRSGWHNMFGNHVMITHNINGQIFTTVYAHLHQTPFVSVGQTVSQGQVLGTMGNTGNSFGAHLHFEIYKGHFNWPHAINPRTFINFPSSW